MVIITNPQDLPTLETVFAGNVRALRPLYRAGVETVAPVMMLSVEQLPSAIYGIGKKTALCIASALACKGLPHRLLSDHGYAFVDEAFGHVNNAPIGTLHVKTVHTPYVTHSYYVPIKLIAMLESTQPHMTIGQLMTHSVEQLTALTREATPSEHLVELMRREIREINQRLLILRADKFIVSDGGVVQLDQHRTRRTA